MPLPSSRRTVWAFGSSLPTLPAADFCRPVRIDRSTLSPVFETNGRSPEVSSTAFRTPRADLQPVPLMDMGFAVIRPFARHRMPLIRFLFTGSCVCSALLSDPASRRRRCASLSLHLHQVVKRTLTSQLSNMLGTRKYPPAEPEALRLLAPQRGLTAADQSQTPRLGTSVRIGKRGKGMGRADSRSCQTSTATAAEPGDLLTD
jgi:hypothetical protein